MVLTCAHLILYIRYPRAVDSFVLKKQKCSQSPKMVAREDSFIPPSSHSNQSCHRLSSTEGKCFPLSILCRYLLSFRLCCVTPSEEETAPHFYDRRVWWAAPLRSNEFDLFLRYCGTLDWCLALYIRISSQMSILPWERPVCFRCVTGDRSGKFISGFSNSWRRGIDGLNWASEIVQSSSGLHFRLLNIIVIFSQTGWFRVCKFTPRSLLSYPTFVNLSGYQMKFPYENKINTDPESEA
jgi:hypothetical protein